MMTMMMMMESWQEVVVRIRRVVVVLLRLHLLHLGHLTNYLHKNNTALNAFDGVALHPNQWKNIILHVN